MNQRVSIPAITLLIVAIVLPSQVGLAAPPKDKKPPVATITTAFAPAPANLSSTFLAGLINNVPGMSIPRLIEGKATDDVSGIKSVTVSWKACGDPHVAAQKCTAYPQSLPQNSGGPVGVTCSSSTRRSCIWESTLPLAPGFYEFTVFATDKTNKRSPVKSVRLLVAA